MPSPADAVHHGCVAGAARSPGRDHVELAVPPGFVGLRVMLALALLLSAGCRPADRARLYTYTRFSMDTVVEFTVIASSEVHARRAVNRAHAEIERVSSLLWEDDPGSAIFRTNGESADSKLDPEVGAFLERLLKYSRETGGAFDPTLKPILDLYPFGEEEARPPSDRAVEEALSRVGVERLRLEDGATLVKTIPGMALAVGGVAKGYAVDRAVQSLRAEGIEDAIVNAGGDLYCLGSKGGVAWSVGIRNPDRDSDVVGVLEIRDLAVATSGDYQRYFDFEGVRYHHIMDPGNGFPARASRNATVTAETAERADALATGLFVLGESGIPLLEALEGVEGMVIDSSGVRHATAGFARFLTETGQVE